MLERGYICKSRMIQLHGPQWWPVGQFCLVPLINPAFIGFNGCIMDFFYVFHWSPLGYQINRNWLNRAQVLGRTRLYILFVILKDESLSQCKRHTQTHNCKCFLLNQLSINTVSSKKQTTKFASAEFRKKYFVLAI